MSILHKCYRKYKNYIKKKDYEKRRVSIASFVSLHNVEVGDFSNFAHHCEVSNSKIGKRTSVGRYTKIQFANIGMYCSISWDVTIGALEHPMNAISTHAFSFRKQFGLCSRDYYLKHQTTHIGNDVWIGCGAIIMPGVTIGDGAVIGAGAVVLHDVMPYEIVAGVPAKHIRFRFPEEITNKLLLLRWWDFDDNTIKNNIDLFSPLTDITIDNDVLNKLLNIKKENEKQ